MGKHHSDVWGPPLMAILAISVSLYYTDGLHRLFPQSMDGRTATVMIIADKPNYALKTCVESLQNSAQFAQLSPILHLMIHKNHSIAEFREKSPWLPRDAEISVDDQDTTSRSINSAVFTAARATETLIFLPYDCIASEEWLKQVLNSFYEENVGIVSSKIVDTHSQILHAGVEFHIGSFTPISTTEYALPFLRLRGLPMDDFRTFESGSNLHSAMYGTAIRTTLFHQLYGFRDFMCSPITTMVSAEDLDLSLRAQEAGFQVKFCNDCVVKRSVKRPIAMLTTDDCSVQSWHSFFSEWNTVLVSRIKANYLTNQSLYLSAPIGTPSGFGNEAIDYAKGLEGMLPLKVHDWTRNGAKLGIIHLSMETCFQEQLIRIRDRPLDISSAVYMEIWTPEHFAKPYGVQYGIGRHMYETDRFPSRWLEPMSGEDAVWVPCQHNMDTFSSCGVDPGKLHKVPESVDTDLYNPGLAIPALPIPLPGEHPHVFLSVFEWTDRKDWRLLIEAFLLEFGCTSDVILLIKSYQCSQHHNDNWMAIYAMITEYFKELGYDDDVTLCVVVIGRVIPRRHMPRLYKAVDCFVLPSHGEGWGRPMMEAMSMALPVIATGWSGNTEFMTKDNSILLDYDIVQVTRHDQDETYLGHNWAQARLHSLTAAMRYVVDNPAEAKRMGMRARMDIVANYSLTAVARHFVDELASLPPPSPRTANVTIIVAFKTKERLWELMDSLRQCWSESRLVIEVLIVQAGEPYINDNDLDPFRGQVYIASLGAAMRPSYITALDQGVEQAVGDVIVLVTDQTIVSSCNIYGLYSTIMRNHAAIGALLVDNAVATAGYDFAPLGGGDVAVVSRMEGRATASSHDVAAVDYLGLALSTSIIRRIGALNEAVFPCNSGVDLSIRLRRSGVRVMVSPDLVLRVRDKAFMPQQGDHHFMSMWKDWIQLHLSNRLLINRPIIYSAPFSTPSGYANEAISFVLELEGRVPIMIEDQDELYGDSSGISSFNYPEWIRKPLLRMQGRSDLNTSDAIRITHSVPGKFKCSAAYCIGRTLFETDRIPKDWTDACNAMNETWVSSSFNYRTFRYSGVHTPRTMPQCVDTNLFDPGVEPLSLPNKGVYNFLSLFEYSDRKDFPLLLQAYMTEFTAQDDVVLYVKTHMTKGTIGGDDIDAEALIKRLCEQYDRGDLPRVEVMSAHLSLSELPRLYKAVDCFVLPSHGEGWGRPMMEAMSMALPVIATGWSGNTEFMTKDNSILLDYDIVQVTREHAMHEQYVGHKWAQARLDHLRSQMRMLREHPDEGRDIGRRARGDIMRQWNQRVCADRVIDRLKEIGVSLV